MNFISAYPSYQQARQAFMQKREELNKCPRVIADITNLLIRSGSDTHKFLFVPVKVSIDHERLIARIGFVNAQPLMEELANEMTRELARLMEIIHTSGIMEMAYGIRGSQPDPVQTKNVNEVGRTGTDCSTELGTESIPGPSILSSGSDI